MKQRLQEIWFHKHSRYLAVNLTAGVLGGIVAGYVAYSIAVNFFDFDFLFAPYGSPDRSSIFQALDIEASDPRWMGMLKGAGNTLSVVGFAIVAASLLGLAIGVARLTTHPLINGLGNLYVQTFRNLPLLLIMFFFAFAVFRSLPQIEAHSGVGGIAYVSNRGMALPWLEAANSLWPVWVLALLTGAALAWVVRNRRLEEELRTGRVMRPGTWGVGIFLFVAIVAYFALAMPVWVTLPSVTQSASGFYTYSGGNVLGLGYLSALISLSLYFSAFIAEIVRGSMQAVPHGQVEAAAALGLSPYQRFSLIVLPQALRIMIPLLNNEFQNTNKDSTLAYAIAYGEIVLISNRIVNNAGNLLQTYIFIFFVFVLTNLIISLVMNSINKSVRIR